METVYNLSGSLTLQNQVLEAVRTAILTCEIEPGSRIIQEELAARLGVSRIPLREAFRTLQGEGLIMLEPNRGAICRPLEAKDLSDLYDVRLALEMLAVRTAAARLVNLEARTERNGLAARAAAERRDLATLIALDSDFHSSIARSTGNAHIVASLGGYWSQVERAMHFFFTIERYPGDVWVEHLELARAIAVGDGELAATAIERHILASRDAILHRLKEANLERATGR
ncbi:MAG: GntR family transcriptional regulator [Vulcanimicrobiaceae bacterium]